MWQDIIQIYGMRMSVPYLADIGYENVSTLSCLYTIMPHSNSLHAFPTWLCCWRIDSSLCETTSICKYDTNLKNARAPKKGTTYSRSEWTPFTVLRTNWQQPAWQRAAICKCDTHLTSGTVFTAACCQHSLHANVTWLFGKCDMIIRQMWHDCLANVTLFRQHIWHYHFANVTLF